MKLRHPKLDEEIDVPDSAAEVLKLSGWREVRKSATSADKPEQQGKES